MFAFIQTLILFALGFFILVRGSAMLVNGASSIARIFSVSEWVIGIVIVGIGTSIPETSIMIAAALSGSEAGVGTIVGSTSFNLLFILGIAALIAPLSFRGKWAYEDVPISLSAVAAGSALLLFPVLGESGFAGIARFEALLLIGLCIAWIGYMLVRQEPMDTGVDQEGYTAFASLVLIVFGVLGVFFGGSWVVDAAEKFALVAGISEALVGLTLLALGTSIPNLAVTLSAVLQGKTSIAVGSIIGNNIFNYLGILGLAGVIMPIGVSEAMRFDLAIALIATLGVFAAILIGKDKLTLSRAEGVVLLMAYFAYLLVIVARG